MNKMMNLVLMMVVAFGFVVISAQDVFAENPVVLTYSEYPSWSVFAVVAETMVDGKVLIEKRAGQRGLLEEKWDVDIVLKGTDYDSCIGLYTTGQADAVCITNIDIIPLLSKSSVAIMPTSTSYHADALLVPKDVNDISQIKDEKICGLTNSVSEFLLWSAEKQLDPKNTYRLSFMDPELAAVNLQNKKINCAVLWNPFVLQSLKQRDDIKVLFDSAQIPGYIIDMIVMSEKSLKTPEGKKGACAIADAFYIISKMLANADSHEKTLEAIRDKFAKNLTVDEMKIIVTQTRFYATPEQGIALFAGGVTFPWEIEVKDSTKLFSNDGFDSASTKVTDKKIQDVMPIVVQFCKEYKRIRKSPTISYGSESEVLPTTQLRFDTSFMKQVTEKQ